MKLLPHQQEFVDENPDRAIMAWGTRVGKSYAIIAWLQKRDNLTAFLICPKRLKAQWQRMAPRNTTVITKEEAKKLKIDHYEALVVDEAHHLANPLNKPSQLTRRVYEWVREHPDAPVLLATATPITSHPASLHTLGALTGHYVPFKKFQTKYYRLVRRPYRPQPFWEPSPTWRKEIQHLARKWCHLKTLADVTEVPKQRHHTAPVTLTKKTLKDIATTHHEEPMQEWYDRHQKAQRHEKLGKILDITRNEPKAIIVCKYKEQIEFYRQQLKKHHYVITLTGDTKDQAAAIKEAQNMVEGYFIIQADAGEGFRGDNFDLMIFASMSWRYVSYEQMLGRVLHLDKKHSNDIFYLLADEKDERIYQQVVEKSKDFSITALAGAHHTRSRSNA